VEIITRGERRRSWTLEQKREIVAESLITASMPTDVARETYLEESYYHRLPRRGGSAVQRVFTDDRSLDETMAVADRDRVLVPRGYQPGGGFDRPMWKPASS
jgi:5-deoxy-D-glucuronate isomerase